MAEDVLKKVEEQLNCSICLDTYTAPKLLQCFHAYCQQCLVPLVVRDQQGKLGLTCPICRQVTPIPATGVAGLPPAFHINHLLEIRESLLQPEGAAATPEEAGLADTKPENSTEGKILTKAMKKVGHCSVHEGKELELYCETCGESICWKCALKTGKHQCHDYVELDQAFEEYKREITPSLEPLEKHVTTVKKSLAQLDAWCEEVNNRQEVVEDTIYSTFIQIQEVLNVRKMELVDQVHRLTQNKLKGLKAQRNMLETTLAKLSSCLHFIREGLNSGSKGDVIAGKTNMARQVKELTAPLQPDMLEPNMKINISFTAPSIATICQNYGQVKDTALGTAGPTLVVDNIATPWGVAITQKEEVVVTEWGGCCVSVFSHTGEKLRSFGSRGSSQGQLKNPRGVAVDGEGNILVADSGNNRIQRFTPEGQFLAIQRTSDGTLPISSPTGIAFSASKNMIYVVERDSHRVKVLNSDFSFFSLFGKRGRGEGQFCDPRDVACDSTGNVYVADKRNHNIQVFTADGNLLRVLRGYGGGELRGPTGVTIDINNMVYISESGNNRLSVFTSGGQFVTSIGRMGEGLGEFFGARGLAVDNSGMVYVCDADNNRLQRLQVC